MQQEAARLGPGTELPLALVKEALPLALVKEALFAAQGPGTPTTNVGNRRNLAVRPRFGEGQESTHS